MMREPKAMAEKDFESKKSSIIAEGLVTVKEAAEFLGLGVTYMYALMNEGKIAYCKIGKSRRIPRRELFRFAEATLQGGERPAA